SRICELASGQIVGDANAVVVLTCSSRLAVEQDVAVLCLYPAARNVDTVVFVEPRCATDSCNFYVARSRRDKRLDCDIHASVAGAGSAPAALPAPATSLSEAGHTVTRALAPARPFDFDRSVRRFDAGAPCDIHARVLGAGSLGAGTLDLDIAGVGLQDRGI